MSGGGERSSRSTARTCSRKSSAWEETPPSGVTTILAPSKIRESFPPTRLTYSTGIPCFLAVDETISLRAAGVDAPVMIGGAAVSEEWAKEIGATYSADAGTSVDTAKQLAGKGA